MECPPEYEIVEDSDGYWKEFRADLSFPSECDVWHPTKERAVEDAHAHRGRIVADTLARVVEVVRTRARRLAVLRSLEGTYGAQALFAFADALERGEVDLP